jgi:hypothetical protein
MFIVLIFSINGCAEKKYQVEPNRYDNFEKQEEIGADREATIQRYGYKSKGEMIHIRMGEAFNYKCEYILLSPIESKNFIIEEIITISSKKERFDLVKRKIQKTQGSHITNLKIILPIDLNPGKYQITTSIISGRIKNTAKAELLIRR